MASSTVSRLVTLLTFFTATVLPVSANNHSLAIRQTSSNTHPDYTCGPDRPCQNQACCGKSNVCGYGDLYCGDGCQSNCDAHAECGRDALEPGKECPLNVCCSQFGFCGTTSDFCDSGCQSNCGQPSKPGSGGDARNKIIGYWESWRANDVPCGAMAPEDIPVEALDQLNLAFIYIDPETFELMPMDGGVITDLYERVANTKLRNPHLQVWISVGGWSFNDPGPYRSIFGAIAGDSRLSAQFAQNCIDFMNQYGFDGIDIDWEYPGADDRGGTLADIANFPRMLGIIQNRLKAGDGSGKRFGLTITVPTSYWYLRWFDLAKIAEQIDEFNLMTYDLHGIWDRTDPIGPYVYAHTNLTEIDIALDLFWRNGISNKEINLGLGFYGRTFKLKDPKCSTPGCEFTGPGDEGSCTKTAGILSYREIRGILEDDELFDAARYDEEAGVYYVTYGEGTGDSWVSFDDSVSFQAKVDLANSRGLGGLFIWAVDQDNDNLDALRAVSQRDVVVPPLGSGAFGAFDLDKCYITDCNAACNDGDTTMTHLNQDESSRGCDGKNHNQRSFCCPPSTAPDPDTCYWTGGPTNCHGQCDASEVSMVLDDWGDSKKRCTNGGKKVWCCPATNGQSVIDKCGLVKGKTCPSDRPQALTYVSNIKRDLLVDRDEYQTFCCPDEPKFDNCAWAGDNYYCNDNECPLGQVELFRHHGSHGPPAKSYSGCNKGRRQAFCCDAPFTDGSPFLPVPLENLFPYADSFPLSYEPVFAEAFDYSKDLVPEPPSGQDPNKESFAWIIMVGASSDVQSFDKRDGTHLELFDCPNTAAEDFSTQRARAICLTDSEENDCEDILEGGVEGTIVKLPPHCGPDQWVRAVKYEESTDRTLPRRLQKRSRSHHKIYDFHYDYNFRNLRRDGGEVYVRIEASNHPGYWDEVVARPAGSPIKRDASTWRDLDRRSFSEDDPSDWKKRFDSLLSKSGVGLKKHYEFNQCLFEGSAVCGNGSASASAFVSGEFDTTMDFGISLIGALRTFTFTESFAYFRQEAFSTTVQAGLSAAAKLRFDSGYHPVGSFNTFGSNYNLKGILTINPYYKVDARVQAEASISAQATVELGLKHPRFQYYLPTDLGNLPTEPTGNFEVTSRTGPITALGEISTSVGGDVIVSLRPTVGFDIQLAFLDKQLVDTSVRLTTQADVDFGIAATIGSNCNGLQIDIKGQLLAQLIVENALPGWKSGTFEIEQSTPKEIYSDCLSWRDLKRDLSGNETMSPDDGILLARQTLGDPLPDPAKSGTCAFSVNGVFCTGDKQDDPTPNCNIYDLEDDVDPDGSSLATRDEDDVVISTLMEKFYDKVLNSSVPDHHHHHHHHHHHSTHEKTPSSRRHRHLHERHEDAETPRRSLEKRGSAVPWRYCDPNEPKAGAFNLKEVAGVSAQSRAQVKYEGFPDSSKIRTNYPDMSSFTYEDPDDCDNYELRKMRASEIANTRQFASEHVLENQMFPNFMNSNARRYSGAKKSNANNPDLRSYEEPRAKEPDGEISWCLYMSRWWNLVVDDNQAANEQVVKAYPANGRYEEELYLLDSTMNSQVKQTWFSGNAIAYNDKLPTAIKKADWDMALKYMKRQIVTWKYFQDTDVASTLATQADRVAKNLEEMETKYIPSLYDAKDKNGNKFFDQKYVNQGLPALWRTFVREQHLQVQVKVKKLLQDSAEAMYKANRPENQQNSQVVRYMENVRKEVNSLTPWSIPWVEED